MESPKRLFQNAEIRKKVNHLMSFSKMTFPHEMVHMILSEQLFRAVSIRKGSKYHRE
ncbi:MAG TPA: hypothetical protein EYM60_00760 [Candidatus Marinimicrobia bacterium]|nr:hypothetical protein [Candidatus Neomarinimicrobiota bacterium]